MPAVLSVPRRYGRACLKKKQGDLVDEAIQLIAVCSHPFQSSAHKHFLVREVAVLFAYPRRYSLKAHARIAAGLH